MGSSTKAANSTMENLFLKESASLPRQILPLEKFLTGLSQNFLFSMQLKDPKTRKVLMSNAICAEKWGLTPQEMKGMEDRIIFERVVGFVNLEEQLKIITESDNQALDSGHQQSVIQVIKRYNGEVQVQKSIRSVVYGGSNKPLAIAAMTYDLTRYTDLGYLFQLYQQYYPKKSEAVSYFSRYTGLNRYFTRDLAGGELKVLLTMISESRQKKVATLCKISFSTLTHYLSNLKDKLKPAIDVHKVLHDLRTFQKWTPVSENSETVNAS